MQSKVVSECFGKARGCWMACASMTVRAGRPKEDFRKISERKAMNRFAGIAAPYQEAARGLAAGKTWKEPERPETAPRPRPTTYPLHIGWLGGGAGRWAVCASAQKGEPDACRGLGLPPLAAWWGENACVRLGRAGPSGSDPAPFRHVSCRFASVSPPLLAARGCDGAGSYFTFASLTGLSHARLRAAASCFTPMSVETGPS